MGYCVGVSRNGDVELRWRWFCSCAVGRVCLVRTDCLNPAGEGVCHGWMMLRWVGWWLRHGVGLGCRDGVVECVRSRGIARLCTAGGSVSSNRNLRVVLHDVGKVHSIPGLLWARRSRPLTPGTAPVSERPALGAEEPGRTSKLAGSQPATRRGWSTGDRATLD